jgi:uncharacterized membrane protein YfcA
MAVMSLTGAPAIAALAVTGLATGFIAGLLGIGGGAFLIAGMVLFVGMNQHIAQGSSLLSMVPAAAVGSWTHWRHGNVVTSILPGPPPIIIGAFLGIAPITCRSRWRAILPRHSAGVDLTGKPLLATICFARVRG